MWHRLLVVGDDEVSRNRAMSDVQPDVWSRMLPLAKRLFKVKAAVFWEGERGRESAVRRSLRPLFGHRPVFYVSQHGGAGSGDVVRKAGELLDMSYAGTLVILGPPAVTEAEAARAKESDEVLAERYEVDVLRVAVEWAVAKAPDGAPLLHLRRRHGDQRWWKVTRWSGSERRRVPGPSSTAHRVRYPEAEEWALWSGARDDH
ncbi:hypothetical protein ACWV95_20220 [Streptomyces albus]